MNADDIRTLFEYNSWATIAPSTPARRSRTRNPPATSAPLQIRPRHLVHTSAPNGSARTLPWPLALGPAVGLRITRLPPSAPLGRRRRDINDSIASLTEADLARVYEFKTTQGAAQAQPGWQCCSI